MVKIKRDGKLWYIERRDAHGGGDDDGGGGGGCGGGGGITRKKKTSNAFVHRVAERERTRTGHGHAHLESRQPTIKI